WTTWSPGVGRRRPARPPSPAAPATTSATWRRWRAWRASPCAPSAPGWPGTLCSPRSPTGPAPSRPKEPTSHETGLEVVDHVFDRRCGAAGAAARAGGSGDPRGGRLLARELDPFPSRGAHRGRGRHASPEAALLEEHTAVVEGKRVVDGRRRPL